MLRAIANFFRRKPQPHYAMLIERGEGGLVIRIIGPAIPIAEAQGMLLSALQRIEQQAALQAQQARK